MQATLESKEKKIALGHGYQTISGNVVDLALTSKEKLKTEIRRDPVFEYTATLCESDAELQKTLKIAVDISAQAYNVKPEIKGSYSKDTDQQTQSRYYVIELSFIHRRELISDLSPDVIPNSIKTGPGDKPADFYEAHGDVFISQVNYGEKLVAVIRVDAAQTSKTIQWMLEPSIGVPLPAGAAINASGKIESMFKAVHGNSNADIKIIAVGNDTANLQNATLNDVAELRAKMQDFISKKSAEGAPNAKPSASSSDSSNNPKTDGNAHPAGSGAPSSDKAATTAKSDGQTASAAASDKSGTKAKSDTAPADKSPDPSSGKDEIKTIISFATSPYTALLTEDQQAQSKIAYQRLHQITDRAKQFMAVIFHCQSRAQQQLKLVNYLLINNDVISLNASKRAMLEQKETEIMQYLNELVQLRDYLIDHAFEDPSLAMSEVPTAIEVGKATFAESELRKEIEKFNAATENSEIYASAMAASAQGEKIVAAIEGYNRARKQIVKSVKDTVAFAQADHRRAVENQSIVTDAKKAADASVKSAAAALELVSKEAALPLRESCENQARKAAVEAMISVLSAPNVAGSIDMHALADSVKRLTDAAQLAATEAAKKAITSFAVSADGGTPVVAVLPEIIQQEITATINTFITGIIVELNREMSGKPNADAVLKAATDFLARALKAASDAQQKSAKAASEAQAQLIAATKMLSEAKAKASQAKDAVTVNENQILATAKAQAVAEVAEELTNKTMLDASNNVIEIDIKPLQALVNTAKDACAAYLNAAKQGQRNLPLVALKTAIKALSGVGDTVRDMVVKVSDSRFSWGELAKELTLRVEECNARTSPLIDFRHSAILVGSYAAEYSRRFFAMRGRCSDFKDLVIPFGTSKLRFDVEHNSLKRHGEPCGFGLVRRHEQLIAGHESEHHHLYKNLDHGAERDTLALDTALSAASNKLDKNKAILSTLHSTYERKVFKGVAICAPDDDGARFTAAPTRRSIPPAGSGLPTRDEDTFTVKVFAQVGSSFKPVPYPDPAVLLGKRDYDPKRRYVEESKKPAHHPGVQQKSAPRVEQYLQTNLTSQLNKAAQKRLEANPANYPGLALFTSAAAPSVSLLPVAHANGDGGLKKEKGRRHHHRDDKKDKKQKAPALLILSSNDAGKMEPIQNSSSESSPRSPRT